MTGTQGVGGAASAFLTQPTQFVSSILGNTSGGQGPGSILSKASSSGVSANISSLGQLLTNLQQLQAQNPAQFQQVLNKLVTQLQAAAKQQGQSSSGQPLSNLVQQLQNVANGASLSQLKAHFHHDHQTYGSNGQSVPPTTSSSSTPPAAVHNIQQLFSSLATQTSDAVRTSVPMAPRT